jgi:uncharacterized protein
MIDALGERESREFLQNHQLGHLGCIVESEPYVVPISYWCDGEYIYSHSLPGLKINAIRQQPRICLQVEAIQDSYNWKSVIAFGFYNEITAPEERERILTLLLQQLPQLTPVESRMISATSEIIVFRLVIERVTGVYEKIA